MSIAVETDADFTENIGSVMQEVDYILNLNFGIKVEYYHIINRGLIISLDIHTLRPFVRLLRVEVQGQVELKRVLFLVDFKMLAGLLII